MIGDAAVSVARAAWLAARRESAARRAALAALPDAPANPKDEVAARRLRRQHDEAGQAVVAATEAEAMAYRVYALASAEYVAAGSPSSNAIRPGLFILAGAPHLPEPAAVYWVMRTSSLAATVEVRKAEDAAMVGRTLVWDLTNLEASVRNEDVRLAERWEPAPPTEQTQQPMTKARKGARRK